MLIDHHTLLRRCLAAVLNRRSGFHVVGDIATGSGALDLARSQRPDVILVDPETPECGSGLIELLCENVPDAAVVVLTPGHDDAVKDALIAGARGCVEKTCEPEDLVRTIRLAHAGELVMAPHVVNSILQSMTDQPEPDANHLLTKRELEVLERVVEGRTNPQIGRDLFITEHTVKGHLAKILNKLNMDNRVQLATYAVQHGLVTPLEQASDTHETLLSGDAHHPAG